MAATTKLIIYNGALRELGSTWRLLNLTTANAALTALEGAFAHAVEYVLSRRDWNFARRRATLSGVADTSFAPYTHRFARPADYLRKCWVKSSPTDTFQIDHAEVGAVIYARQNSALLEYMSDDAGNYDPANWPPQFTRCMELYLAVLAGPALARHGGPDVAGNTSRLEKALDEAIEQEDVFTVSLDVPAARLPVMRRAIEMIGQAMAGSRGVYEQADLLRWHMSQAWDHGLKWCLEQGAWNFATRRAVLTDGTYAMPDGMGAEITEGYFVPPAPAEPATSTTPRSEYEYGYLLPGNFLHKVWVKAHPSDAHECAYQFMHNGLFTDANPAVLEYVGSDDDSRDPEQWPATFTEVMAAYLAHAVVPELRLDAGGRGVRVSADGLRGKLDEALQKKLSEARMKDAVQQQVAMVPLGSFARARMCGGLRGYR